VKDAKAALNGLDRHDREEKRINDQVELVSFDDFDRFEKEIRANKIDLIFLFPQEYYQLKNRIPFDPIAVSTPWERIKNILSPWCAKTVGSPG